MCYRKPGPRCAAHVGAHLSRALAQQIENATAFASGAEPPHPEVSPGVIARLQEEFDGTATGQRDLTACIEALAAGDAERNILEARRESARALYEQKLSDLHHQPVEPEQGVVADSPPDIDPGWFARLAPHQQRQLAAEGTISVLDATGDSVDVVPGVIDDNADWVYKRGQCLALAVAMAEKTGGAVYVQRVDFDDTNADGEKFYNLGHAYVQLPEDLLLDIQGEHGEPADLVDEFGIDYATEEAIEPLVFTNPRDALTHFEGYLVHQDLVAAEPFARRVLAEYRLGSYVGECDYDALGVEDAKALIDTHLIHRYTAGDCGILAHHLAERNGWGVCVVGTLDEPEEDGDEVYYGVESLQHAYAVRPDGMLVDVRGVHAPSVADELASRSKTVRYDYPDAASADRVWDHQQWYDDGDPWGDDFDDEDEKALAAHVAALVTIAHS